MLLVGAGISLVRALRRRLERSLEGCLIRRFMGSIVGLGVSLLRRLHVRLLRSDMRLIVRLLIDLRTLRTDRVGRLLVRMVLTERGVGVGLNRCKLRALLLLLRKRRARLANGCRPRARGERGEGVLCG